MAVHLRAIEERALPLLRDWRNSEELRHTFREHRLLNMLNQQDWLARVSRDPSVEMFGIYQIDMLVGVCGLCNINWVNRTAEVSILVKEKHARLVMKELHQKAFEEYNLHRLWAEVYEFDLAKIALLEKHGYAQEGRLREHVFKLGKYHDSLIYGLLRC